MKSNFDCSQLISFDWNESAPPSSTYLFENIGFEVKFNDEVQFVKLDYFKEYSDKYFIDFVDKTFAGEFEDWKEYENPTKRIIEFSDAIQKFISMNKLTHVKLFISFFAEKDISDDHCEKIKCSNLLEALFLMSKSNFDIWVDNLIIEIE
ncbi:hypothetical protein [Xenorhabdus griffiniae]|uniref:Uncharacterized protein n=1 Tax=Xenorhabdus griffiniae TaxID=351672 RepID=A0ABY9XHK2_9GAMM|nr:hypothetical protein [Xenorhabdus griffiniae]MBD1228806.1 hypothetical protein [Xenorhabdus griffiniae]MBE8588484.1 hypothetical protein [Xenorhabdus griffiniae]WMV72358.1 hypothetical protein QL128_20175 [Xenorhabdus griffiniae]WNH02036.1 hypothetical protein QL112_020185 [Xenorhabdus griffiniae]